MSPMLPADPVGHLALSGTVEACDMTHHASSRNDRLFQDRRVAQETIPVSAMRLDIRRIAAIKDGDRNVGNRTKVKVVKNKMAPPFKEAQFDIMFGEGISREGELIDLGVVHNVVDKSGAWFSYNKDRLGQGRENSKQFLRSNPEVAAEIEQKVRAALGIGAKEKPVNGAG